MEGTGNLDRTMIESYVRQHVVRGRLKEQHAPRGVVVEAATGIVVDKGSRRSARHVTIGPPPASSSPLLVPNKKRQVQKSLTKQWVL